MSSEEVYPIQLESLAVKFFRQFVARPLSTGAIAPSSPFLARAVLDGLQLHDARAVLEYGPGTGAFTRFILRELPPAARFAAIEVNPRFAEMFSARYPHVPLFRDSAANVRVICDAAGMDMVDCIISGLPWAAFPESSQVRLLDAMMRVLKPGGRFATFAYIHGMALPQARRFSALLPKYFTKVSKSRVVWLNLPPAFVYRCRR